MKKIKTSPKHRIMDGHVMEITSMISVTEPVLLDETKADAGRFDDSITDQVEETQSEVVTEPVVNQNHEQFSPNQSDQSKQPLPTDEEVLPYPALPSERNEKKNFWNRLKKEQFESKPNNPSTENKQSAESAERSVPMNQEYTEKKENPSAVVSETMVIRGDVELDTSLFIAGKIHGNVTCSERLETKITCVIEGDVKAKTAVLMGGEVTGNVTCEEQLTIEETATIRGDVVAQTILISGSVTGNVTAAESVTLTKSASVHGNLTSASISVESGATLEGQYTVRKNAE